MAQRTRPRLAMSRGGFFMALAVLLPAIASLLAPVFTSDIAYQIRTGQLMLETGTILDRDPFTFTVGGQPWLNQQWGASLFLGLAFDTLGWSGLLIVRALLIGLTFALVLAACRASGATAVVSSLVTIGSFAVAATNLALRAQTFGLLCFAALVAILAWRRRYPWLLWTIPPIMIIWANTHGSFFIGWLALAVAVAEDILARSRWARRGVTVTILSVLATVLGPWGLASWGYVLELSTNPVIARLISEWQPSTMRTVSGLLFFASVGLVVALLVARGRALSWLQVAWLGALAVVGLMAERGVAWWAIGAAPLVTVLVSGLQVRRRSLADPSVDERRSPVYGALLGVLLLLGLVALPIWRPSHPLYGPEGMLRNAPRGVTETLLAEVPAGERVLAEQVWGSWLELAVPEVSVMVDSRIELFDVATWADYVHVVNGRADWPAILDRWGVTVIALSTDGAAQLRPFLGAETGWVLLHEDEAGVVYTRSAPPST
jgi:hypothetical protein